MSHKQSLSIPGDFYYCPTCADIYGEGIAWRRQHIKTCACPNSAQYQATLSRQKEQGIAPGGLEGPPFRVCHYCQATIVVAGSRWSTYYCEACRPTVLQINDLLDHLGLTVPPIGGHSLQNSWRHGKPFLTIPKLRAWHEGNLRRYWKEYEAANDPPSTAWVDFAAYIAGTKTRGLFRDFDALIDSLQALGRDELTETLNLINSQPLTSSR